MKSFFSAILKPRAWVAHSLILILVALFISLESLEQLKPVRDFLDADALAFNLGATRLSAYLIAKGVLTVFVLIWIVGIISEFGENRIKAIQDMNPSNKTLITKVFQIGLYALAFIVTLDVVGIDLTALAVFGGAVGIGLGFGLQKITSNFISGIILLFEKSVVTGDVVELADGMFGFVRRTSARYTLIETLEGKEIMIPNEDFIINRVTNWTYSNTNGRVDIAVGVSYTSDIEKARDVMLEAAREHPRCMQDPGPVCYLREYADSSVNFVLYFWVEDITQGRWEAQSDVMRAIWRKFKENDIAIPFPQRDVHIKDLKITNEQLDALKK